MKKTIYFTTAILIIIIVFNVGNGIDLNGIDKSDQPTVLVGNIDFISPGYVKKMWKEISFVGKEGCLEIYPFGSIGDNMHKKYYAVMVLINRSGVDIDSNFSMTVDMKYKDRYLFRNAKFEYDVNEYPKLPSGSSVLLNIEVKSDEYKNLRDLGFSNKYKTTIRDFKYKKDVKWNSKFLED